MNKHTPTPWNFEGRAVYSQTEGEDICIVDSGNRKVDVANAAHIVRCVNSHEALVKALEDCVRIFENELSGLAVIGPELRQARAAVAAAKEQP